jgi:hypothetical protein
LADNTGDGGQIFSHSKINNQMIVAPGGQIRYTSSPSHYDNSRASTDTLSMNKPGLACFIFNSTMQYSVNGVFDDTLASRRGTVGTLFNQLGAREEKTEGFDGLIGEIIITDSIPDTDTRQKIEGYLAHKWSLTENLPADHLHRLSAPVYSISKTEKPEIPPKPKVDPPKPKPDPTKTEPTPNIKSWSPIEIPTAAWYDAADTSTITAKSSVVSQWRDKSGNSLHLSQVTAANQPTSGAKINGRDALDFTSDFMTTASNPFSATVSDAFVILVHKVNSIQNGSLFSLTGSVGEANRWGSHAPFSDGALYFDCGGAVAPNRVGTSYGVSAGNVVLSSFYCSTINNVQQVYKNGNLLVGDSSGHSVSTAGNISVGGVAPSYQDSTIGEFIIINGTVDDATRQLLEGYLAHKWATTASLPANHPYKLSAPTTAPQILDVLTPQNTEYIKTLKEGEPVTLQGTVRSAKFSSTEKSIYISFSDPAVEKDIRVVIHGSDYEGGPFTEEEFAKLIERDIVFNGAVYTEKFNDKSPFVKITAKEQIKRATQKSTQNKLAIATTTGTVLKATYSPEDINKIKLLEEKAPVKLVGFLNDAKLNASRNAIIFNFSKGQINGVVNKLSFKDNFDPKSFDKFVGKKILIDGILTNDRSKDLYLIEFDELSDISIVPN